MSSISLGSNPTPIHYLFLFGLRTSSETFQPLHRVQLVKERRRQKTATKKQLKREATHAQLMTATQVNQARAWKSAVAGGSAKRNELQFCRPDPSRYSGFSNDSLPHIVPTADLVAGLPGDSVMRRNIMRDPSNIVSTFALSDDPSGSKRDVRPRRVRRGQIEHAHFPGLELARVPGAF